MIGLASTNYAPAKGAAAPKLGLGTMPPRSVLRATKHGMGATGDFETGFITSGGDLFGLVGYQRAVNRSRENRGTP